MHGAEVARREKTLIVHRSRNSVPYVRLFPPPSPFFIVYVSHVDLNDPDRAEDYGDEGGWMERGTI